MLAPSNPRSRKTLRAASRMRVSTSPASSFGGRPKRTAARFAFAAGMFFKLLVFIAIDPAFGWRHVSCHSVRRHRLKLRSFAQLGELLGFFGFGHFLDVLHLQRPMKLICTCRVGTCSGPTSNSDSAHTSASSRSGE